MNNKKQSKEFWRRKPVTSLGTIRSKGIPVSPKRICDIRLIVTQLRNMFGISNEVFCDIVKIIEYLGSDYLPDYGYEIIPDNDPLLKGKFAETFPQEKIIRIKESVYNKACEGDGQSRFTIAHELGHLCLKHEADISFARQMPPGPLVPWRDAEWQADVFAAEFLMPYEMVKGMSTQEICNSCGVSRSAAETRRQKLKKPNWQ